MTESLEELVVHRMVEVGDVRLHVVEAGEGPLVVLLHGFPEFWYSWRHQIPALAAAGYRVVAPDLRGYHLSDRPGPVSAYRGEALTGDVAGLIAACGESRATVVGHDWGGIVAWLTAMTRPEVVERLVVCNAPHPARFAEGLRSPQQWVRSAYMLAFQAPLLPELVLSAGRGAALRALLRLAAVRPDAFTDAELARYAEAFPDPAALRGPLAYYRWMGRRMAGGMDVGALTRRLLGRGRPQTGGDTPRAQRVRRIDAPTLVLWGTRDPVLPVSLADPGEEHVPDRRVRLVEHAGHFVQADAPEQVNAALLAFLAEGR
jgi:pimeloyl-ACP methyl ester carboxylesterase